MAHRHPLEPLLQPDLTALVRFTQTRYDAIAERIGYAFKDKTLLRSALTHASSKRKIGNYERLEFLGDRVLGLVIAEELFRLNPGQREGDMSARHSALVRGETCAEAGRLLHLEQFIVMGDSEAAKNLHLNTSIIGDAVEALIAALYLDCGLEAARRFILHNWERFIAEGKVIRKDAKTFLQEWALARALPIPEYRIMSREGPEHAPSFAVEVEVRGSRPVGGFGPSKRLAEQAAAETFLKRENIRS